MWIASFKNVTSDQSTFFLVGNRFDWLHHPIPQSQVSVWADVENMSYHEVSTLSRNGINELVDHGVEMD
jgi:hypothetical protein